MFSQVLQRITVSEVVVAVIMYIIVRTIIWLLKQVELVGENEVQRLIHSHIHNRHSGHYRTCTQCSDIVTIDELTI